MSRDIAFDRLFWTLADDQKRLWPDPRIVKAREIGNRIEFDNPLSVREDCFLHFTVTISGLYVSKIKSMYN